MEHSTSVQHTASTDFGKDVTNIKVPYAAQDIREIASLVRSLEGFTQGKKSGIHVKKTKFDVEGSREGLSVDSWRFQDWDYKKGNLPTYARGLFTSRSKTGTPEIVIRGYDKFFNTDEVHETKWENILTKTQGPYELTLKENGCIIFISGLEDDTLLVCSKHSTGVRSDIELSHAQAGKVRIEAQLQRLGKTTAELARELRKRNVTAVAELCDDSFEEHILAYGPGEAGLYLHGININIPEFMTYPSSLVQRFADDWGFVKTGLIVMDDIQQVKAFLEDVAETGAHDGRDVEGFVIRCKMSHEPEKAPYLDWFFKYKFEEPYLMYRQWRECTKALIGGRTPKYKKHQKITGEYLQFAKRRLASDRNLAKLYNQNHGIIALRNEFLAFKNLKGSDAAMLEDLFPSDVKTEVTKDVILVPIATLGCGKTTVAVALTSLFGWGHIQNDNITGARRPPRFTKALLDELDEHPAVFADRNNAQKHERKQLLNDVKEQHLNAKLVALHFVHDNLERVKEVTRKRVYDRGDNHQTIQAASDMNKVRGIMDGFVDRFQPLDLEQQPDNGFDAAIDLDPSESSRVNLEKVVVELHRLYPSFMPTVPTAEAMDTAIQAALDGYRSDLRHTIPDRGKNKLPKQPQQAAAQQPKKKKALEYMAVDLPTKDVLAALDKTFAAASTETARFFKQLQGTRRVQPKFHVTLMHRASAKENPALWERYTKLYEAEGANSSDGKLGDLDVLLERVVFDSRIMAIVVRLVPHEGQSTTSTTDGHQETTWECMNRVAHVTVGTRDEAVKPKESNDLLSKWLSQGSGNGTGISDLVMEGKPVLKGIVRGVLSR